MFMKIDHFHVTKIILIYSKNKPKTKTFSELLNITRNLYQKLKISEKQKVLLRNKRHSANSWIKVEISIKQQNISKF